MPGEVDEISQHGKRAACQFRLQRPDRVNADDSLDAQFFKRRNLCPVVDLAREHTVGRAVPRDKQKFPPVNFGVHYISLAEWVTTFRAVAVRKASISSIPVPPIIAIFIVRRLHQVVNAPS